MAAGMFDKPGSEHGPCEGDCAHEDCALTRSMTSQKCVRCGEPIGYETGFFDNGFGSLTHEDCEYKYMEEQRAVIDDLRKNKDRT